MLDSSWSDKMKKEEIKLHILKGFIDFYLICRSRFRVILNYTKSYKEDFTIKSNLNHFINLVNGGKSINMQI